MSGASVWRLRRLYLRVLSRRSRLSECGLDCLALPCIGLHWNGLIRIRSGRVDVSCVGGAGRAIYRGMLFRMSRVELNCRVGFYVAEWLQLSMVDAPRLPRAVRFFDAEVSGFFCQ